MARPRDERTTVQSDRRTDRLTLTRRPSLPIRIVTDPASVRRLVRLVASGRRNFILVAPAGRPRIHIRVYMEGPQLERPEVHPGAVVDWSRLTVERGLNRVEVTRTELRLLNALLDRDGAPATCDYLARRVWPFRASPRTGRETGSEFRFGPSDGAYVPLVSSEQSRPSEVEDIGSYRAVGDETIHRGSHWAPQQQTGRSQRDPLGRSPRYACVFAHARARSADHGSFGLWITARTQLHSHLRRHPSRLARGKPSAMTTCAVTGDTASQIQPAP